MATAFSYSGTGLESAIATGSGGLSSTATSVEVDAISSDLSAGDTVKVALGTATNFANGNGEVAHGDIGTIGGGANGGTDITGLSRGQEGTSASSWSEGDPVRVGVQGRDDAGPERPVVRSQGPTSKNLLAYDDFPSDTTNADGYTVASGQSLTTQQGNWVVENKGLRTDRGNTTIPSIITFSLGSTVDKPFVFKTDLYIRDNQAEATGLIIDWTDIDNYKYVKYDSTNLEIIEVSSGSASEVASSRLSVSGDVFLPLRVHVNRAGSATARLGDGSVSGNPISDTSTLGFWADGASGFIDFRFFSFAVHSIGFSK